MMKNDYVLRALEISQNSQENTCEFSCEFCEIPKNTYFYKNTSGGCFGANYKKSWQK